MSQRFDASHASVRLVDEQRNGPRLKVWWIPQVPMQPFEVYVNSFAEAKILVETLAQYDLFQFENKIKPDYCNGGGVMIDEDGDGEYSDLYEDESGREMDELTLHECVELDREWLADHAEVSA